MTDSQASSQIQPSTQVIPAFGHLGQFEPQKAKRIVRFVFWTL